VGATWENKVWEGNVNLTVLGYDKHETHKRKEKKRETTQAAKHSLHQLRKRRHIGLKCRESPPPKDKRN
jgi:hypothetical protein